jgi:hypothetical protein
MSGNPRTLKVSLFCSLKFRGLGPIKSALFVEPYIADQQDADKDEHGDERVASRVGRKPGAVQNGPGKEEDHFDVEDNEQHGDDVEARGIATRGVAFGGNAAFVGQEFCGTAAGFGSDQLKDEKSDDRERNNE